MSQYFPKPYEPFRGDINVKVDLSNYATKTDLKCVSHVSRFVVKSNLASLRTEADKLDFDKLVPIPVDLGKFCNIDTTGFVSRTRYEKDGSDFEKKLVMWMKKFLMLLDWLKKSAKITEIEDKIPSITGLANT